jgi:hypothetical protein
VVELLGLCHNPARKVLLQLEFVDIFGRGVVRPNGGAIEKVIHYQCSYQEGKRENKFSTVPDKVSGTNDWCLTKILTQ